MTKSHPDHNGWLFLSVAEGRKTGRLIKPMLTSGQAGKVRKKGSMERIAFETTVQYEPSRDGKLSDLSRDLSEGGLYLKTRYPLDTDATLTLSFSIPKRGQEISITCEARVAWTNLETNRLKAEYPSGAGLQFLDLPREGSAALSTFINAYSENKKMNVVCAWCGKSLGLRKGPFGTTSHGICSQCRENLK